MSAWHRGTDLRQGGFIAPTGETSKDPVSGKERIVSRITPAGLAKLADLDAAVPLFD